MSTRGGGGGQHGGPRERAGGAGGPPSPAAGGAQAQRAGMERAIAVREASRERLLAAWRARSAWLDQHDTSHPRYDLADAERAMLADQYDRLGEEIAQFERALGRPSSNPQRAPEPPTAAQGRSQAQQQPGLTRSQRRREYLTEYKRAQRERQRAEAAHNAGGDAVVHATNARKAAEEELRKFDTHAAHEGRRRERNAERKRPAGNELRTPRQIEASRRGGAAFAARTDAERAARRAELAAALDAALRAERAAIAAAER